MKKLDPPVKEAVKATVTKVIDLYTEDRRTEGLGIKRLRGPLWEARAGIKVRVIYELTGSRLNFVLAGSHDDVVRFLRV